VNGRVVDHRTYILLADREKRKAGSVETPGAGVKKAAVGEADLTRPPLVRTMPAMLNLAAFADEIGPELDDQIRVCRDNDVTHFELRGVRGLNVLDFPTDLRNEIRTKLRDNGMGVASVGSPIGKVKIDEPWEKHFDRFKIAVESAQFFAAPFIRIFSYYPPQGGDIKQHRDEVVRRMNAKLDYIERVDVTLVHENEADIYGEHGRECLDLMKAVNRPKLRSAFDFANFVIAGERPRDNWPLLKPYTAHIHVKDAVLGPVMKIVPPGQGDGDIPSIVADAYQSGYRGFLTMEPHLKVAGHSHGETGPELFKVAVDALKGILREKNIPLARA
jgi:3-dehydroshikimate dehydratase